LKAAELSLSMKNILLVLPSVFSNVANAFSGMAIAFDSGRDKIAKLPRILMAAKAGFSGFWEVIKANKVAVFITAIIALVTVLNKVTNAARESKEALRETYIADAEKAEEQLKSTKEISSQLSEIIEKYEAINASNLIGISKREKLKSLQQELNDLLGKEASGIDIVNGKLSTQLKTLKNINSEHAEKQFADTIAAAKGRSLTSETETYHNAPNMPLSDLLPFLKGSNDWFSEDRDYTFKVDDKDADNIEKIKESVEKVGIVLTDYTGGAVRTEDPWVALSLAPDASMSEIRDTFEKAIKQLSDDELGDTEFAKELSRIYTNLFGKGSNFEKTVSYYQDALNTATLLSEDVQSAENNSVKSYEEYLAMRNEVISELKKDYPELQEAVENGWLTDSDIAKAVDARLQGYSNLTKYFVGDNIIRTIQQIQTIFSKRAVDTAGKKEFEEANEWFNDLSPDEKTLIYQIGLDTTTAKWKLDDWKKALSEAKKDTAKDAEEIGSSLTKIFSSKESEDGETFSARIKTYRENINSLEEALEKYQNVELDADSYNGLIDKFPQLAGHTKDLDVAITSLMDDMDSDMVSDFSTQFGKLDTQEDIDALRAYLKELQASTRQTNSFSDAYNAIHSKVEAVMSWADRWNEITNGNVDYNKRPLVSPEKMKEAFPDFEGEIATTYTQYFSIGEGEATYTIDITPILEDGTVLNQESLEEYVDKLVTDNGIEGLLASDDLNLVVNVVPGDYDEAYWDKYQSKLNAAKNTHWELIKQLQEETGLTWDEIVEKYGAVIDSATKFNSKIEETVSAFNTVKSVVNDYNENGFLSLENVQSILSLSDRYILALTNEQGALDLSTESYKKLVEAELLELKAQALQDSIDYVGKINTKAAALVYLQGAKSDSAQASLDLADAQWKEAMSAAAVKDIEQGTGDLYQRTVIAARKAYETKVALIDNYAKTAFTVGELSTATDDYTKALNNEKDGLEKSKKALEDQKKALEETKQGYEDALSSVKDLVDWVQDYIKQIKNDEIDALEKKKETLDDLIDKQKELLDAEKEEYEWNKTISEKQNTVAKDALAASIASLDDSAAGRKAQKEAMDKLSESRTDMHDTLYDHEIEIRKQALDDLKQEQDEYYDNLIEEIRDYLGDEVRLYKDACAMIDNDSGDLYGKLLWYCQNYTTTTEAEFNHMWNSAQSALQQYNTANLGTFELLNDLQGRIYEVDNAIDTISQSISSYESAIDGVQGKLDNLSQSAQKAISDIQAAANAEDEWTKPKWVYTWQDNDYKSWKVNRDAAISDIIKQIESRYGGVFPASAATIYGTIRKYASGTNSAAGGLSLVGERGAELRVLKSGDGILKNQIVRGLTALGTNPAQFLAEAGQKMLATLFGNRMKSNFGIINKDSTISPSISIVVQGDATQSTLNALEVYAKKISDDTIRRIQSETLRRTYSSRVR